MSNLVRRVPLTLLIPLLPLSSRNTKFPFENIHPPRRRTYACKPLRCTTRVFAFLRILQKTSHNRSGGAAAQATHVGVWRTRECAVGADDEPEYVQPTIIPTLKVCTPLRSRPDGPACARDCGPLQSSRSDGVHAQGSCTFMAQYCPDEKSRPSLVMPISGSVDRMAGAIFAWGKPRLLIHWGRWAHGVPDPGHLLLQNSTGSVEVSLSRASLTLATRWVT